MKKKLLATLSMSLLFLGNIIAQKKPNIIIFYLDDMGYGDISLTGATGHTTPAIDRLANEGMFFTNYYSPHAISTASRAGLLTGCYATRVGVPGVFMVQPEIGLNPQEEIIPEMLKTQGYTSALVGKWHLGSSEAFMPLAQGFDEFYGLPYSNDIWPVDYAGKRRPADDTSNRNFPILKLYDGKNVVKEIWTLEDQAQLTTLYTERSQQFIKENKDNPFFLYIAHAMPHVPLAVSDKFKGKSNGGLYGDVMMEIDWSVNQVMQTLKEYNLEENTLIIFTSDNGPWITFGNHSGSTAGFREGKQSSYEGGQRVPCIMKWKGVIPEGIVNNQLISGIDILPTLASITGAQLPKEKIDGVNILPLMKGNTTESPRKYMYYYYGYSPITALDNLEAVRDARFKLVFPHNYQKNDVLGRDGFPGKPTQGVTELSLYDLRQDPGERYDVKDVYPEKVKELSIVADEMRVDLGDALTKTPAKNIRSLGRIEIK